MLRLAHIRRPSFLARARAAAGAACAAAALACAAAPAQAAPGDIATVAGTGAPAFSGDGGAATAAALNRPTDAEWLADGSVLVADMYNHRVRRIWPSGIMATVAGTGAPGLSGDGGPATGARLNSPTDVEPTADGGFLIADMRNGRVRKVSGGGAIATVAGGGASTSNGVPATSARLEAPAGVAALPNGGFLVAESGRGLVRAVTPAGAIWTVAGRPGDDGATGDGGPATSARLLAPVGLAVLPDGGFLVSEYEGHRVRRVWPSGTITRAAGTGTLGFSGDGGAATSARLAHPSGLSATSDGGFLVADTYNGRVRRVTPHGTIATAAGSAQTGFAGDGGAATLARLNSPVSAAEGAGGSILIADSANNRVRMVEGTPPAAVVVPPPGQEGSGLVLRAPGVVRAGPGGVFRLHMACAAEATAPCRGTIRVRLVPRPGRGRAGAARAARPRPIAHARFSVAPGRTKPVTLHLNRHGRRLLRKRRTLTVEAVATRRGGPNIGDETERVTFKLKRKRRGRAHG